MSKGDKLCIISAMKMETVVASPVDGVVKDIAVVAGSKVTGEDLLVEIE